MNKMIFQFSISFIGTALLTTDIVPKQLIRNRPPPSSKGNGNSVYEHTRLKKHTNEGFLSMCLRVCEHSEKLANYNKRYEEQKH